MPDMFTVNDADTGRPLRRFRFSDPLNALSLGYAYVAEHPGRDFVVRTLVSLPVPASRIKADYLARRHGASA